MDKTLQELASSHPTEYRLFWALDDDADGLIAKADFMALLERNGLTRKDPRLLELLEAIERAEGEVLDFADFFELLPGVGTLIARMMHGELAIPDFPEFSVRIEELFEATVRNEEGQQATYIPPLAEVNPDQFGVALVSVDGQLLELGDTEVDFSVQSACKPFNYCFAQEELGAEKVHQHVGMEPSGQAFNARVLMGDGTGRPHNPMVNAGAIMTASLVQADQPLHRRLEHIKAMWGRMIGGPVPRFNAWMAQEESRTGDNNRALGYMMKAAGVMLKGEDAVDHELRDALELYFSTCSLEFTARELATAAATLANNGVCPTTQERVLDEATVRNCLTMMQMCGMYDGAGEFSLTIGLPAKSGVGGAVILVVPGLMGVCVWSPRLDAIGNSVRGVEMANRMAQTFRLHLYDGASSKQQRLDPADRAANVRARGVSQLLKAASIGDMRTLQRLVDDGADLSRGDYDGRTPLHLAAAEGQLGVVKFLINQGVSPNLKDRWGGTPLGDAEFSRHTSVSNELKQCDAEIGEAQHLVDESPVKEAAATYGDDDAVGELLWAASENDLVGLQRCVSQGIPVNVCDYDNRTALHLAAAEGQLEAVEYLLAHDHPIHVRDRWGSTPLDEARREGRDNVADILTAAEQNFSALNLQPDRKEVGKVTPFVARFTQAYGVAPAVAYRATTALEDLMTCCVELASQDSANSMIRLQLEVADRLLIARVLADGEEFDPLAALEQADSETEENQFKEISLRLIKGLSDEVYYERAENINTTTLKFSLERE